MLSMRSSLAAAETASLGNSIFRLLTGTRAYKDAAGILVYVSVNNEADTRAVIDRALADGKKTAVPRIISRGEMKFISITDPDELAANRLGIPEPEDGSGAELSSGLVIVPGLAFDTDMNRLGYGGGYYDRWFACHGSNVVKCALAYDFQVMQSIPHEEKDVKMDCIITPERIITAQGNSTF